MSDNAEAGEGRPRRGSHGPPALDKLPVVPVTNREELAVMLARHNRVLRDYARHYLRDAPEEAVERAVSQAMERLFALDSPSFAHGLRNATVVVYKECRRIKQHLPSEPVLMDPRLGLLTNEEVRRAIARLGLRAQRDIYEAARGRTPAEIGQAQGRSAGAVRSSLSRARARAWMYLHEPRQAMPAWLLLAPGRVRSLLARDVPALHALPQSVAAITLVPLLALWSLTAPSTSSTDRSVTAPTQRPQMLSAAPPAALQLTGHAGLPASPFRHTGVVTAVPHVGVPSLGGAAGETPEDVVLRAAATPPDNRPVIVAIGRGNSCGCSVMMQSLDGGATWTATDGPPADSKQIALPPDYPSDPRIFIGVDPHSSSQAPYEALGFGQRFNRISGLQPGLLAVSAHFDDGDPRVFSAGSTAVWSIQVDSTPAVARDEVDYSAAAAQQTTTAALTTPKPSGGGPAVVVWAPALAFVPGSATLPATTSSVLLCPTSGPCGAAALLDDPAPGRIDARQGDSIVAYSYSRGYISHDGGRSFDTLPLPPGGSTIFSLTVDGTSGLWMSVGETGSSTDVLRFARSTGSWVDASAGSSRLRSYAAQLLRVGDDRIIALFGEVGYRCIGIVGSAWAPRCPAT